MLADSGVQSPTSWTSRSETLDERLARLSSSGVPDRLPVDQLLDPWAKALGAGGGEALERRLAWDEIPKHLAAFAFCRLESLPDPVGPAVWEEVFTSFLESTAAATHYPHEDDLLDRLEESAGPVPFREIWFPWILWARTRLVETCPSADALLSESAQLAWQAHLLRRLATVGELVAYELFKTRRDAPSSAGADISYRRFIEEVLADPVEAFYDHFPILARQLSTIARNWTAAIARLLRHFGDDRYRLAETFGGKQPTRIARLECVHSDPHSGGQEVLKLELDSGLELAYKPRSLNLERALGDFLKHLELSGFPAELPTPPTLSRPGYGWQQWLRPAESGIPVEEYYRRAGALVALAYVLRARDLHAENLVATARGPAVVDAEMFLQPVFARLGSHLEPSPETDCLESGLLIQVGVGDGGKIREWGGLRAEPQRRTAGSGRAWTHLGTDRIKVEAGELQGVLGANVFQLEGRPTRPEDHVEAIVRGFDEAYRFFLDHRELLSSALGPLDCFRGARARLLLRPSQDYATTLSLLAVPRNQKLGLRQSLLCEALQSGLPESDSAPKLWSLAAVERHALIDRDIPHFTLDVEGTDDIYSDETARHHVEGAVELSGLDAVRRRIAGLCEEDLVHQTNLIQRALRPAESLPFSRLRAPEQASFEEMDAETLSHHFQAWSCTIADRLLEAHPETRIDTGNLSIQRGRLGLALFFAAVSRHRPDESSYREAATRLAEVKVGADQLVEDFGLGGFSGVGSVLFGLTWLAELTQVKTPLDVAVTLNRELSAKAVCRDRRFDVEKGTAGLILGLLTLCSSVGEEDFLDLARCCGDHLLEHQRAAASGGAGWAAPTGLLLAGWAHGQAGIARALFALGEATGHERYRVAAAACVAYERAMLHGRRGNWPVLLAEEKGGDATTRLWRTGWCHGAPGIALARLYTPPALRDDRLREELETAITTTASAPQNGLDHLCCGELGRAAILDVAGERLGLPHLKDLARRMTARVMDRALAAESFRLGLDPLQSRELQLGFLKGLPGIGYYLLRLAGDRGLPDVLALESLSEARNRRPQTSGSAS